MNPQDILIDLNNVSLVRGDKSILRDITWRVLSGENWVLFGKSGAGKTMLLEILSGYQYPTRGEIKRFGVGYGEGVPITELRKRIGYVSTPLNNMFYGDERIIDVIISGMYAAAGLWFEPVAKEQRHARDLLSTVSMADRAEERFGILSDGEKRKILMLRALINEPSLLLLDEPVLALDIPSREDMLKAIQTAYRTHGTNIIYVTHHTEEILPQFKHILILDEGTIFYRGPIRDGLYSDRLQVLFNQPVQVVSFNDRHYTMLA